MGMETTKSITINNVLPSFVELLTILFIGLKLGNVIDWSWWWVFSPMWVSWLIIIFAFIVVLILSKNIVQKP